MGPSVIIAIGAYPGSGRKRIFLSHGASTHATIDTPSRAEAYRDPQFVEAMLNRVPLHRFGTSEEVAAAACYLAGSQGTYITGHTLVLDGGLTAY